MADKKTYMIKGIPAAPGLAHGETVIIKQEKLEVPEFKIDDIEGELARLTQAIEKSRKEIMALKESVSDRAEANEAEIFEAHKMFLEDAALLNKAKNAVKNGVNAEKGWHEAIEFFAQMMENIPDETLSSRAMDIRDVGRRVLGHLLGVSIGGTFLNQPSIIVGKDLTPSDTASLDKDMVLAFCTAEGGPTSHTAILSKAFGLPAVVGLGPEILDVPEKTMVLVNGGLGEVVVSPNEHLYKTFLEDERESKEDQEIARKAAQAPAMTADGDRVEVVANIGSVVDAPTGIHFGAEGVGLFRTEFLYLDRKSLPNEQEQIDAYAEVFSHYPQMPVVVRTLDIGGDKMIPYLELPVELNPFLGWRGIRMIDGLRDIFFIQFKSLLQAAANTDADLRIMLPMVSSLAEIRAARSVLDEAIQTLQEEGKNFTRTFQFGIMIEVPAAALMADRLAEEVDFFSIGTNDLTQYTLAVDRTNSKVAHLAHPLNPAVLALISHTIKCAHAAGKWVGLCGELAGDPVAAPILLGLGLDEFSMSPASIPGIKQVMQKLYKNDCQKLAESVLILADPDEVIHRSRAFLSNLGLE